LFIFGLGSVATAVYKATIASNQFGLGQTKSLSISLIQSIDIFLLATVLYVITLGLYELFINQDLKLPEWLVVNSLEDLEHRLFGVIAVIISVTFLGKLVELGGGQEILQIGIAVGIVLISIATVQFVASRKK